MNPRLSFAASLCALALIPACKKDAASESPGQAAEGSGGPKSAAIRLQGITPQGTRLTVNRSMAMRDAKLSLLLGAEELSGSIDISESHLETITFINPTARSIKYGAGARETSMKVPGIPAEENREEHPLAGQTIAAMRGSSTWTYTPNGTLSPEQNQKLEERREIDADAEALYPPRDLKVGDRWDVGLDAIGPMVTGGLDVAEGAASMHLAELVEFGGRRCARLEVEISASGKLSDDKGPHMEVSVKLKGELHRSLELFQDVSLALDGSMEISRELEGGGRIHAIGPLVVRLLAE